MTTRRERVVLDLEDNFSAGMARAAAATALVKRELNSLSGTSVRTSRDNDTLSRSVRSVGNELESTTAKVRTGTKDIDRYSGRLGLLLNAAAALGPALIPIGAAAIPAVAGLTAGLGAAAGAFGVTLLAANGLGDGLKALDAYQLEPTAENLAKLQIEMEKLGPAGAEFVRYLDELEPVMHNLQNVAREGLFPGVEEGIDALLTRLPQAKRIIFDIAQALGDVAADTGKGLAGEGFRDFFNYLETDAAPTLKAFAEATGNVASGIANLIVGVSPLTRDFTSGLVSATQSFEDWTASLAGTQGFQDFLSYVRETGPQVLDLVGQLAVSLAAIAEAAAPVGQALLPALTAIAKVVGIIAKSDLGTPLFAGLAAMSALRLATAAWGKIAASSVATFIAGNARAAGSILTVVSAQERAMMSSRELAAAQAAQQRTAIAGAGRLAAVFAGLTLASGALGDSMASSNAATMGLMGSFAGPFGAAAGVAIGSILDLKDNSAQANSAIDALHDAMRSGDEEAFATSLAAVNDQLERQTSDTIYGTSFLGDHIGSLVNAVVPLTNYQKLLGGVTGSTSDLKEASEDAAGGVSFFGEMFAIAGRKAQAAARWNDRVQDSLIASREAAQETANAFLAFGDSLDDSKVSLNDWIAEQQQMADALQNFAKNAADAARKGLDQGFIQKLKEAGPEGALRMKQLADASESQIARINHAFRSGASGARALNDVMTSLKNPTLDVNDRQMRAKINAALSALRKYGLTRAQAALLAQDLASGKIKTVQQLVNKYGMTRAEATALLNDLASGKLKSVQGLLSSLDGQHSTSYIDVIHRSFYSKVGNDADPATPQAGGGFVPKTGLPYADRHPYLLADGEGVTTNRHGETDMFRDVIVGINRGLNRTQIKGMLADGGFAGGVSLSGSVSTVADRILGLTVAQIKHLGDNLDHLSKSSLTKLSKALDKAAEDAKADAQEIRQARSSLAQSVRDLIAGGDLFTVTDINSPVTASGGSQDYQDLVAQHNALLASQPHSSVTSNVGSMLAEGQERLRLIRQLKRMGIGGQALATLATQPIEVLRELASNKSEAHQFAQQYNQLQHVAQAAGAFTGNAVYGQQLKAAQDTNRAIRELDKRTNHELREIRKAIERQRHEAKKNSDDNAKQTAAGVNHGVAKAARRHVG